MEGHGRRAKPLCADYVLVYRNTKLAVVEAKAWDEPLTAGVAQAKEYAGRLSVRFTYSANGQGIYAIDMNEGTEGDTERFPSPEELWKWTFEQGNAWRDRFSVVPFEDRGGYFQGRYYQDIAVERVLTPLLRLKYKGSIADALKDLGRPEDIGQAFSGFQKFLYEPTRAA